MILTTTLQTQHHDCTHLPVHGLTAQSGDVLAKTKRWSWGSNPGLPLLEDQQKSLDYPEEESQTQPYSTTLTCCQFPLRPAVFFLNMVASSTLRSPGSNGESEFDLKICQVMRVVRRNVPYTFQVILLEKKGAKSKVKLPSYVGRGQPAGKMTAPHQPSVLIASQPLPPAGETWMQLACSPRLSGACSINTFVQWH